MLFFLLLLIIICLAKSCLLPCNHYFNNIPHKGICIHVHCISQTWFIIKNQYFGVPLKFLCNLIGSEYNNVILFSYCANVLNLVILRSITRLAYCAHNTYLPILDQKYIIKNNLYYSCTPHRKFTFPSLNINPNHTCYCESNFKFYFIKKILCHISALFSGIKRLSGSCLPKLLHYLYSQSTYVSLKDYIIHNKNSTEFTYYFVGIISVLGPASVDSIIDILLYYLINRLFKWLFP